MAKNENLTISPMPVVESEQPQLFEGYEVDKQRFTLRVGPDLDTEFELRFGKRVSGRFSGVITEVGFKRKRDGSIVRVHVVEVDEADLS